MGGRDDEAVAPVLAGALLQVACDGFVEGGVDEDNGEPDEHELPAAVIDDHGPGEQALRLAHRGAERCRIAAVFEGSALAETAHLRADGEVHQRARKACAEGARHITAWSLTGDLAGEGPALAEVGAGLTLDALRVERAADAADAVDAGGEPTEVGLDGVEEALALRPIVECAAGRCGLAEAIDTEPELGAVAVGRAGDGRVGVAAGVFAGAGAVRLGGVGKARAAAGAVSDACVGRCRGFGLVAAGSQREGQSGEQTEQRAHEGSGHFKPLSKESHKRHAALAPFGACANLRGLRLQDGLGSPIAQRVTASERKECCQPSVHK